MPNVIRPDNKIPKPLSEDTKEIVDKLQEIDKNLQNAKGGKKLKLFMEKIKLSKKLADTDFKTY